MATLSMADFVCTHNPALDQPRLQRACDELTLDTYDTTVAELASFCTHPDLVLRVMMTVVHCRDRDTGLLLINRYIDAGHPNTHVLTTTDDPRIVCIMPGAFMLEFREYAHMHAHCKDDTANTVPIGTAPILGIYFLQLLHEPVQEGCVCKYNDTHVASVLVCAIEMALMLDYVYVAELDAFGDRYFKWLHGTMVDPSPNSIRQKLGWPPSHTLALLHDESFGHSPQDIASIISLITPRP